MNYIVDPMLFYWMDILTAFEMFAFIVTLTSGIVMVVMLSFIIGADYDIKTHNEKFCQGEIALKKALLKYLPLVIILFVMGTLINVLIPSKDTMLYMLIAHTATIENCELTVDGIKAAVDYIIEAMAQLE